MHSAMTKREALLEAGYSEATAKNPKANFYEAPGYKKLIEEYRKYLIKAGITPEIVADIQAEGLFDQNAGIRLGYIKEFKKDWGISFEDTLQTLPDLNITITRGEENES